MKRQFINQFHFHSIDWKKEKGKLNKPINLNKPIPLFGLLVDGCVDELNKKRYYNSKYIDAEERELKK